MTRILRRLINLALRSRRLDSYLRQRYAPDESEPFPRGHYYSPLPDKDEVAAQQNRIFTRGDMTIPGIDLRPAEQAALLAELAAFYRDFDCPEQPAPGRRFYLENNSFGPGDAIALYSLMRYLRPRQIIEVGSGFSSALMLDTRERFLDVSTQLTFIEPDPSRLLKLLSNSDRTSCRIIAEKVQDVPVDAFGSLRANDILFIDSSHVSKAGSDVNYLFFEVLPTLRSGVVVHVHDVFWPFEYPLSWIEMGRAWNEQYLLRAFLMHNRDFEVLLFNQFVAKSQFDWLCANMYAFLKNPGGSFWMRKR